MSWETSSLWITNQKSPHYIGVPLHIVICNYANWGHVRRDVEAINPSFDVKILSPQNAFQYLRGLTISGYTLSRHLARKTVDDFELLLRDLDIALGRHRGPRGELPNV